MQELLCEKGGRRSSPLQAAGVPAPVVIYGPCMEEGSLSFALMTGAMREVCALAEKEGIPVGEKEVEEYLAILRTLDPDAVPSMG